jgi:hypothetical protein
MQGKYREFSRFRPIFSLLGSAIVLKNGHFFSNSLLGGTGNFFDPIREQQGNIRVPFSGSLITVGQPLTD